MRSVVLSPRVCHLGRFQTLNEYPGATADDVRAAAADPDQPVVPGDVGPCQRRTESLVHGWQALLRVRPRHQRAADRSNSPKQFWMTEPGIRGEFAAERKTADCP